MLEIPQIGAVTDSGKNFYRKRFKYCLESSFYGHDLSMAGHNGISTIKPTSDNQSGGTTRDLLLDVGVPFRINSGVVFVEAQAHNGLLRWLDNFPRITLCAPVFPDGHDEPSMRWIAVDGLLADGRLNVSPFPWGYDVKSHLKHAGSVRKALRKMIPQHRYLCFSNLGWLGAWGRIGVEEAYRSARPYAIWLDWVLHEMPVRVESNPLKRTWHRIQHGMLERTSIRDVRRCSLGLFHGRTVFDAYAPLCKTPRIVHDIHLGLSDIISTEELEER
jgi:colanic acid/amylovoran biosynthesis glycosyltransferase